MNVLENQILKHSSSGIRSPLKLLEVAKLVTCFSFKILL